MKLLVAGDAHGKTAYMMQVIRRASELEVPLVVQLGDFGFWPRGHRFLAATRREAERAGITLWVVDGNHDFPGTGSRLDAGYLGWSTPSPKLGEFAHVERGTVVEIDGVRVGFLGGAVSVDRAGRVLGRSFWLEEIIQDGDVDRALAAGPVDIWLTHDAANFPSVLERTTFKDPHVARDLWVQEQWMQTIFKALKPRLHVHGHFHVRYEAPTAYGRVIGLSCEDVVTSTLLIDTDDFPVDRHT